MGHNGRRQRAMATGNGNGQWQRCFVYRIPCDSIGNVQCEYSEVKKALNNTITYRIQGKWKSYTYGGWWKAAIDDLPGENENSFAMTSVGSCIFCGNKF
jgi:hypothetical protein